MEGWLQRRSELAAGGEAVDQEDSEPDPKRKVSPRSFNQSYRIIRHGSAMAEIVKCICNPQEAFPQTTEKVDTLLPLGLREAAHHAMLRRKA